MQKRFISIWFRSLRTDWIIRRRPALKDSPLVLTMPDHARIIITAMNKPADMRGIYKGMSVADARVICSSLEVLEDQTDLSKKLLKNIADWCIRFSPTVAIDEPDGLILDVTGCAHLWGGEKEYVTEIYKRIKAFGYSIRIAIADTIGAAWAVARFGKDSVIVSDGDRVNALLPLPPSSLRIEAETVERLQKLGLRTIGSFINMPRPSLRRRFGAFLLQRLDEAVGTKEEWVSPVQPPAPFHERLPCMEGIVTAVGIEIALNKLLASLCTGLKKEQKGLRIAILKCYRLDGLIQTQEIGTNRPSCNEKHLFKLFENKIGDIEPALGIELFTLDALNVEDLPAQQESLWGEGGGLEDQELAELLDRITGKMGVESIRRYLPAEHYWPERSYKLSVTLNEKPVKTWRTERPRPIQLLPAPQPIEVTAPIPDYPPMMFRYKGTLHKIMKADGPERIEQEWWLQDGLHRDYYTVEDETGKRYWLFRAGHYDAGKTYQWFIHGFFA